MNNPEIVVARSVWLFSTNEVNPLGVALAPVYEGIRERYKFLQYPNKSEDFTKAGLSFVDGAFSGLGVSLEIYADGLIANTRSSTDVSDAFLDDLLTWTRETFKFRYDPLLVKTKAYESQISFTSDLALGKKLVQLSQFAKILEESGLGKVPTKQDIVAIMFRDEVSPRHSFTFERRDNTPFSENKYFSRAAFSTKKHLQLIEEFE
jgi:hypothetical protein